MTFLNLCSWGPKNWTETSQGCVSRTRNSCEIERIPFVWNRFRPDFVLLSEKSQIVSSLYTAINFSRVYCNMEKRRLKLNYHTNRILFF